MKKILIWSGLLLGSSIGMHGQTTLGTMGTTDYWGKTMRLTTAPTTGNGGYGFQGFGTTTPGLYYWIHTYGDMLGIGQLNSAIPTTAGGFMNINPSGQVGIGMSPSTGMRLSVKSSNDVIAGFYNSNTASAQRISIQSPSTDYTKAYIYYRDETAAINRDLILGGPMGSAPLMVQGSTGRVGIGNVTPAANLSIYSPFTTAEVPANISLQNASSASANNSLFWLSTKGNVLSLGGNGATVPTSGAININAAGSVGLGAGVTNPAAHLVVTDNFGAQISGSTAGSGVFGSNLAVFEKPGDATRHGVLYTPSAHASYGYSGLECRSGAIKFYSYGGATTVGNFAINPSPRMMIYNNGKIGIGTAANDILTANLSIFSPFTTAEIPASISLQNGLASGTNAAYFLSTKGGLLNIGGATSNGEGVLRISSIDQGSVGLGYTPLSASDYKLTIKTNDFMGSGTEQGGGLWVETAFNLPTAVFKGGSFTISSFRSINGGAPQAETGYVFDRTFGSWPNEATPGYNHTYFGSMLVSPQRIGANFSLDAFTVDAKEGNAIIAKTSNTPNTGVIKYSGQFIGGKFKIAKDETSNPYLHVNENGQIGIGTPTTATLTSNLSIYSPYTTAEVPASISLQNGSSASANNSLFTISTQGNILNIGSSINIASNGKVSINTTKIPDNYQLAVNGGIYTTAVRIKDYSSWPDYVFDKKYELKELSEVKQYVDQHKHLPEVPSAKEVENDGVDVAQMQVVMMKKIEELTLYIIKQDETLRNNEVELAALRKEMQALKK